MTQKKIYFFFAYDYSKYANFHTDSKSVEIIEKQVHPETRETAQNFEKLILQMFLRITVYTYIPVNLYHFLKKNIIAVPY